MSRLVLVRLLAVVALLFTATSAILAAGFPSPAAASTAGWSQGTLIDASGSLTSVSCPTASFCAAVDYDGDVLTYNGSSWSSPESIDRGARPVLGLVPVGELLCRGGQQRQCPHLRRQLVVVARQHRRRARPVLRLVPDGELLRRGGRQRQRPHLQRQLVVVAREHRRGERPDSPSRARQRASAPLWTASGNAFTYNGSSWSSPESIDTRTIT